MLPSIIRERISHLRSLPYPWVVVGLFALSNMALSFNSGGLGALFPFIQDELGLTRAQLGLLASGVLIGGVTSGLLGGWLSDVLGVRRMHIGALAGIAIGLFLFSMIQSLVQGIVIGLIIGVSFQITRPTTAKGIMDWSTLRDRSTSMGVIEASLATGGIIAAVFVTFLAVSFDWRWAVRFLGLMVLVAGILFAAFYKDKPMDNLPQVQKKNRRGGRLTLVIRNRDLWMVVLFSTAFSSAQVVVESYLVLFAREEQAMSAGLAGAVLAVYMAGGVTGRLAWGIVSDRFLGGRRVPLLAFLGIMGVVSLAFLALLPANSSLVVVLVLAFLVGSAVLGRSPVQVVLQSELVGPALTGTAMGFNTTLGRIGTLGFPPLFGLLVDHTGSYHLSWGMMAGLSALGTAMMALLSREGRKR